MSDLKTCKWEMDEDGTWETECDNLFVFTDGTPEDNSFSYCPYCGGVLEETKPSLEEVH